MVERSWATTSANRSHVPEVRWTLATRGFSASARATSATCPAAHVTSTTAPAGGMAGPGAEEIQAAPPRVSLRQRRPTVTADRPTRSNMRLTGQKICFGSGDSAARNTMAPPWGIYPLQPAQCAGLIGDVLVFTVTLSSDNFIEELGKQGLDAQWVLPSGAEMGPAQPVVTIQGHGRQVTMARAGLEQLMLELTDLQSWARGMDQLLQKGAAGWQPWPYFTEEHKVWV